MLTDFYRNEAKNSTICDAACSARSNFILPDITLEDNYSLSLCLGRRGSTTAATISKRVATGVATGTLRPARSARRRPPARAAGAAGGGQATQAEIVCIIW